MNRIYGIKTKYLSLLLDVSRRTISNDIRLLKKRYRIFRSKKRLNMIPLELLQDHYGLEANELYDFLNEIRTEGLKQIASSGLTPAMVALFAGEPYREVLQKWATIKQLYSLESDTIAEKDLQHFGIDNNIETVINVLSYRLNVASVMEKPVRCTTCNRLQHYCNEHRPFDVFLTPRNNEKVYNTWNQAYITEQLTMF